MGGSGWSRLRLQFRFHPGILIPTSILTPFSDTDSGSKLVKFEAGSGSDFWSRNRPCLYLTNLLNYLLILSLPIIWIKSTQNQLVDMNDMAFMICLTVKSYYRSDWNLIWEFSHYQYFLIIGI